MKNKKNKSAKNNNMNISKKEKEILESYKDIETDISSIEEFEITTNEYENVVATKEKKPKKEKKKKTKNDDTLKEYELIDSILEEYEIDEVTSYEQDDIKSLDKEEKKKEKKEKQHKEKKFKQKKHKAKKEKDEKLEEFEITDDLEEYDNINDNIEEEYDFVEEPITDEKDTSKKKKNKINIIIIINICFGIVILLIILSVLDIVFVVKYEKKPHFAIPIKTYDDGGSKEYIGLGYKVIKYNQVQGRRDIELGTWSLKYNIDPIYLDTIDLAIEANENEAATYEKYNKKFLRISGILNKVDIQENSITVSYIDEGKKYNFDVICNMATSQDELTKLEVNDEVTILGTMKDYEFKSKDNNSTIKLDNCFAEQ